MASVLVGLATPASAQRLQGRVVDSLSRLPIAGAVVTSLDSAGAVLGRNVTNQDGLFFLVTAPAMRGLRVQRLGFRPREIRVPAGDARPLELAMERIAMFLDSIRTTAPSHCPRNRGRDGTVQLLDQARAGLLTSVVGREASLGTITMAAFERTVEPERDRIVRQVIDIDSISRATRSFTAVHDAAAFVQRGFVSTESGTPIFYAPDADVLLDDGFAGGYCFSVRRDRARVNQLGLGFRAPDERDGRIDVDGTLWIDTAQRALREIEFSYVGLDRMLERHRPGGEVTFREMPNGRVLIDRWKLRLVAMKLDTLRERNRRTVRTSVPALEISESGGEILRARWPDGTTWRGALGELRAVTRMTTRTPGMRFRLADTPYRGVPDTNGLLVISDLIPGPYTLVASDPRLAAIHVEIPTSLAFTAARDSVFSTSLQVPTAEEYVAGRCEADDEVRHSRALDSQPGSAPEDRMLVLARVLTSTGVPISGVRWTLSKRTGPNAWKTIQERGVTGGDGMFQVCTKELGLGDEIAIEARAPGWANVRLQQVVSERLTVIRVALQNR